MAKQVTKILDYQILIERLLKHRPYKIFELEDICLCRIGHVACFESFKHALQDLIANGRVKLFGSVVASQQYIDTVNSWKTRIHTGTS